MGMDYSYMLYFKKDLLWAALQGVVDIAELYSPPTMIRFPDHELPFPLESFGVSQHLVHYDDPELEFTMVLYVAEDKEILFWQHEYDSVPDESKQIRVGYIYLTIYTDLCEYADENKTHEDVLAILRPISDLVLFNFGTTGSKMSMLFSDSDSIRKTFIELLERVPGVCGVFNREDSGELFWREGQIVSEWIEAPYLLPGPRDDRRWEPEFVTPCKEAALESRANAEANKEKSLEIDLRNANACYTKAVNLNTLGRYNEAIECFNEALQIDPRNADAWTNKGISLYNLGRYDEAIECFDKALQIDPHHALAQKGKQMALEKKR